MTDKSILTERNGSQLETFELSINIYHDIMSTRAVNNPESGGRTVHALGIASGTAIAAGKNMTAAPIIASKQRPTRIRNLRKLYNDNCDAPTTKQDQATSDE